jgi:hypothetical protein
VGGGCKVKCGVLKAMVNIESVCEGMLRRLGEGAAGRLRSFRRLGDSANGKELQIIGRGRSRRIEELQKIGRGRTKGMGSFR